MKSLDELISEAAPTIELRRSLAAPVLKAITTKRRRLRTWRRIYLGALGLATLTTLAALSRGNSGSVLSLALHKSRAVIQHAGLYSRALLEVLPWPAIGLLALALAGSLLLLRMQQRARFAPALAALPLALALCATSVSAYAAVSPDTTPGPAEQQLLRTINGIGHETVTVDGHTYELGSGSGMTDDQIRAMAEWQALNDATAKIPTQPTADGGNSLCACKVISMTPTSLTYDYWYTAAQAPSPKTLAITSNTRFFLGATPAAPFVLGPDDQIVTEPSPDGTFAAVIAKPSYTFEDYWAYGSFNRTQAKHGQAGTCYNYPQAECPDLPAVYDFLPYLAPESDVPANAEIREVYGTLDTIGPYSITLTDSTGALWTVYDGGSVSVTNSAGIYTNGTVDHSLQVTPGDHLRIEFWQSTNALTDRTIHDGEVVGNPGITKSEAAQLQAQGKLQQAPFQLRSLELALKQPWQTGTPADKY